MSLIPCEMLSVLPQFSHGVSDLLQENMALTVLPAPIYKRGQYE